MDLQKLNYAKAPVFISASDEELCQYIFHAKKRIAFIGTGLSEKVAGILAVSKNLVKFVVLDNSPNLYRQGYGDYKSLGILNDAGVKIGKCKNVRVNILAVDDIAIVFSPIAQSVDKKSDGGSASGIIVAYEAVRELFLNVDITDEETKEEKSLNSNGTVVTSTMTEEEIENTLEEEAKHPPVDFNIKQQLNVYTSKLQFVEIQSKGFNISRKTIKIPKEFLEWGKGFKDAETKLKASYSMFGENETIQEATQEIMEAIDAVRKNYTYTIINYGSVYLLDEKKNLEKEIDNVRSMADFIIDQIKDDLEDESQKAIYDLADILYDLQKKYNDGKFTLEEIRDRLFDSVGSIENYIKNMKIEIVYKNLTLEMLQSKKFAQAVFKHDKLRKEFQNTNFYESFKASKINEHRENKIPVEL